MVLSKQAALSSLPPEWPDDLRPAIRREVVASQRTLVVLDDDPTGTQTVHNLPVLTHWSVDILREELERGTETFYLLTNSRSLLTQDAQQLNRTIGQNLTQASRLAQRAIAVVSRSDSTLRGHFPAEVEALAAALETPFDGWLIIPCFFEGGRYTIGNVHYAAEGDQLIPAGETAYAQDAAFGYRASDLTEWVAEKTGGQIAASAVESISLDEIRHGGPSRVAERLCHVTNGKLCVINAASYRDLEVLVLGLLRAEAQGSRFLYRTAASFVQVRAGITPRPLLTPADLDLPATGGGLFVVGSYLARSGDQVRRLLDRPGIAAVEAHVPVLLGPARPQEIARCAGALDRALSGGQSAVLYTSRKLILGDDATSSLDIGRRVSESLVAILGQITATPRYIVAKGGITSSDVATAGLGVRRAWVLGQLLPGVPVWRLGPESRFPGKPYVVFPGNVGGPDALARIADDLRLKHG
jgi:uncharacterized protein YgbK (DUF1537 family)